MYELIVLLKQNKKMFRIHNNYNLIWISITQKNTSLLQIYTLTLFVFINQSYSGIRHGLLRLWETQTLFWNVFPQYQLNTISGPYK